jgi:predicted aconitase/predicted aconitase with swiveling domain
LEVARILIPGHARGSILASPEGLSFWGGVDPTTGRIIDAHHPLHGQSVSGSILMMPTSRGSCTGSGVLLELIRAGLAPAALVFREAEDVLTLGALVAQHVFGLTVPVLRLRPGDYAALTLARQADITGTGLEASGLSLHLDEPDSGRLRLSPEEQAMLEGTEGKAAQIAMKILCAMAAAQDAEDFVKVSQVHIDGCLYASPSLLAFAEVFAGMHAKVRVPTSMNAISVDHANWRSQGVPEDFGVPASRLADAYVDMGARPTFTCAPYLLDTAPGKDEDIAWAESNAAIYANSVLGARTAKHPDFLDLCIAITGRAPRSGVYLDSSRIAGRVLSAEAPDTADDSFWPLLGYLAGLKSPDRIPLIKGTEHLKPDADDLKALCAAFGTTSAAPMLHVAGHTAEAGNLAADADEVSVTRADLAAAWRQLNSGPAEIDLVAFGSPHFSLRECRALAELMEGHRCAEGTHAIVTLGRATLDAARAEGLTARLDASGIRLIPDLCWCSITEPVFPLAARTVMTNSGKYAHYGPGLSGRRVRFGSLADCALAARTGRAPDTLPDWLTGKWSGK